MTRVFCWFTSSFSFSINLLEQLWDRTDRYRLILIREELLRRSTSQQEHIDLANALAARKADLAARLMRVHIERSHARIASVMMARAADRVESPGLLGNR